jgi:hypothetical protein
MKDERGENENELDSREKEDVVRSQSNGQCSAASNYERT